MKKGWAEALEDIEARSEWKRNQNGLELKSYYKRSPFSFNKSDFKVRNLSGNDALVLLIADEDILKELSPNYETRFELKNKRKKWYWFWSKKTPKVNKGDYPLAKLKELIKFNKSDLDKEFDLALRDYAESLEEKRQEDIQIAIVSNKKHKVFPFKEATLFPFFKLKNPDRWIYGEARVMELTAGEELTLKKEHVEEAILSNDL